MFAVANPKNQSMSDFLRFLLIRQGSAELSTESLESFRWVNIEKNHKSLPLDIIRQSSLDTVEFYKRKNQFRNGKLQMNAA